MMPSSGPRLIVVRARRLAGACTCRAREEARTPRLLPLLTRYTDACEASDHHSTATNQEAQHYDRPSFARHLYLETL